MASEVVPQRGVWRGAAPEIWAGTEPSLRRAPRSTVRDNAAIQVVGDNYRFSTSAAFRVCCVEWVTCRRPIYYAGKVPPQHQERVHQHCEGVDDLRSSSVRVKQEL